VAGSPTPPYDWGVHRPDYLILGAGVVGASIAWHLTQRGARDVVLVDAAPGPGHGSTGRATGGYRGQFSTAINVRLSLLAREKLRRFADEVGSDPGLRPIGYLFFLHDDAARRAFADARAVQHACGLTEAEELPVDAAQRLNPHADPAGAVAAAWCPTDASIRPLEILAGYLDGARRRGAQVVWHARVSGIARDADGRITRVEAGGVTYTPGTVINAAGAWAGEVAALAGVRIPVRPVRRQIAVTNPVPPPLHDGLPMTIWTSDAFHFRIRDGRALLNWPVDTPGGDGFDLSLHRPWFDDVWRKATARLPWSAATGLDPTAHWAGLYEMSPDKTVILGWAPGCPNLLLANGNSGHGVMHAPAVGQLAAELLLDGGATTLDIRPLRPERFAENDPNPVSDLL
jgi:sarcosine oxidase subunit beta